MRIAARAKLSDDETDELLGELGIEVGRAGARLGRGRRGTKEVVLTVENLMSGSIGLPKPGEADPTIPLYDADTTPPPSSMRSQLACAARWVASLTGKPPI